MTPDENAQDRGAPQAEAEPSAPGQGSAAAPQEEPAKEAEGGEAPEEAEAAGEEPSAEERRPLDVYAVLRISIAHLSGVAFQMMGLQADPMTNKIHKDVAQARVAIDATAALVEKLLPHLQGQEARDYQNLLTDLRLNFVKQSGEQAKAD